MIYSFYDPELENRSGLGNYVILEHIKRAVAAGLPYVYLGYWVEGSERMQYKVRFRPLEALGPDGWRRMSEDEQRRHIESVAKGGCGRARATDGGSKDNTPGLQQEYKLT